LPGVLRGYSVPRAPLDLVRRIESGCHSPVVQAGTRLFAQSRQARLVRTDLGVYETSLPHLGEKSPPGLHYMSFSAVLDPAYWFEWFTCDQVGKWNFWKWCNPEFDARGEQAARTMDLEERASMYARMQQLIDEDVA